MASKKRHKQKHQIKQPQQALPRPGHRLDEAQSALAAGNPLVAIDLATKALKANLDPPLRARGQRLLAEAHFRAAAATPAPEERLAHLESASRWQPRQARLHHHAGVTLLRMGRAIEAKQALSVALTLDPNRRGLRFSHQLARLVSGEAWVGDGLTEVELNSLRLAQALVAGEGQPKLAGRFAGQSFVGQADGLWQLLLQMADQPKFSPTALYASERAAAPHLAENPIVAYYAGVVALRAGDKSTALPIWQHLAAAKTLLSLALQGNNARLVREQASALADAEQWEAVAALQPSPTEIAADDVLAEILAAAHFRVGLAAAEAEQWARAAAHWERANLLAPDRRTAQNLALAQERLGAWSAAATAWREMVRRRPRKSDHPDSLTDDQVAAIWRRAADCYAQIKDFEQEIACLRSALKYKERDPELSMRLADACMAADRVEAARNELERLLAIAPDHLQALGRLALIYQEYDLGEPMPLWRRIVALDPANQEAKDALAHCYLELAEQHEAQGFLGRLTKRNEKQQLKILQEGLKEIPGHPILLLAVGIAQYHRGDNRAAQGALRQAWETAPSNPTIVGVAMHELLHVKGEAIVEEFWPSVHNIPGLQAAFWVDQARQAVSCQLGAQWIDRFCQEALTLAARRQGQESPIYTLMCICDLLHDESVPETVREPWLRRARTEGAQAGLGEFVDARQAALTGNPRKAIELLRKGRRLAQKANEPAAVQYFQEIENILALPPMPFPNLLDDFSPEELLEILGGMGGGGRRKR